MARRKAVPMRKAMAEERKEPAGKEEAGDSPAEKAMEKKRAMPARKGK